MTMHEWRKISAVMFWIKPTLPLNRQGEVLAHETGLPYTAAFDAARRYRERVPSKEKRA